MNKQVVVNTTYEIEFNELKKKLGLSGKITRILDSSLSINNDSITIITEEW